MSKFKAFIKQFHWKIFLIRILVNAAALSLTAVIIPDIYFVTPTLRSVVLISVGLGILNAIVKPVILLLTGQFIFVTFGMLVILVNALILYLLERIFSNVFVVNSFFWALVGGVVLGLVSNALENLLGLTPPIVPEQDFELRKRIEAEQQVSLINWVAKPSAIVQPDVETQSVSELTAASAALDALQAAGASDKNSLPESKNFTETAEPSEANHSPPDAPQTKVAEPQDPELEEDPDNTGDGGAA